MKCIEIVNEKYLKIMSENYVITFSDGLLSLAGGCMDCAMWYSPILNIVRVCV